MLRRFNILTNVLVCVVALFVLPLHAAVEVDDAEPKLPGGAAIPLKQYRATGDTLILWLPSESGLLKSDRRIARALAERGVEVWLADLHSAYFLPVVASSIEKMPPDDIMRLIEYALANSRKRLYVVSSGRGALLALRGIHRWQQRHAGDRRLAGAVLISPKLYVKTPEPGSEGVLMPVTRATNLALFLLQPEKSPWRWKMDRIVPALEKSGSDVYVRLLPGVRDRFYYRPDAVDAEDGMAARLPVMIHQALPLLDSYAGKPRRPGVIGARKPPAPTPRQARKLRRYRGGPTPALRLKRLGGGEVDLASLRGSVVLVNFWASWCPPCVHEMPSMQRLKSHFSGRPFRILAVNMAEDVATIRRFLREKVKVDFTILLDSDGAALRRWKVFAFPTSYVVGKRGRIRYALYGAIDWMDGDVLEKIGRLLDE